MSHVINYFGYGISIDSVDEETLKNIKEELTVRPIVLEDYGLPPAFPIYRISDVRIYVPKFYGTEKYGAVEQRNRIERTGDDIDVKFRGVLRPDQRVFIDKIMQILGSDDNGSCIACAKTGSGKCLAIGTPVLMYNGKIKIVEKIKTGDVLMGADSKPRHVVSTTFGIERMHKIRPRDGSPSYTVNQSHILSLYDSLKQEYVDISVNDFLKLHKFRRYFYRGYRVPVQFKQFETYYVNQPYDMGKSLATISSSASETLQEIGIPPVFKCNTRDNRLRLIAGILDANLGRNVKEAKLIPKCDVIHYSYSFIKDVEFVMRSVGMHVITDFIGNVHYLTLVSIYDKNDLRYCKCFLIKERENRKKKNKKKIAVDSSLFYKFTVKPLGPGIYAGFEISRFSNSSESGNDEEKGKNDKKDDKHFLLSDFTVTHNTTMALNIVSQLHKKTLIIVHKDFLLNQWRERIKEFIPESRVGMIKQDVLDIENKDIVIGMLQSISKKTYAKQVFDSFGFTVIDECHHVCSKNFSKALFKIATAKMLGLSATPQRKDGLTFVLNWFLGDIVDKEHQDMSIEIPHVLYIYAKYVEKIKIKLNYLGKIVLPDLINKITDDTVRNQQIVFCVVNLLRQNRSIILLSDRRNHCVALKDLLESNDEFREMQKHAGLYLGAMAQKNLDASNQCDIILATYSMAQEGYDNSKLDTLIMASSKSDIKQSVGRILRKRNKFYPLVVDFIDAQLIHQFKKRQQFYKENDFVVEKEEDDSEDEKEKEEKNKKNLESFVRRLKNND